MPGDSLLSVYIAGGFGIFAAVLTGVMGMWWGRRSRELDTEREIGRVEGRIGSDGQPSGEILRSIGRLEAGMSNVQDDIREIKTTQSASRRASASEHAEGRKIISTMQGQVNKLMSDMTSVQGTLKNLERMLRNQIRRTTSRKPSEGAK